MVFILLIATLNILLSILLWFKLPIDVWNNQIWNANTNSKFGIIALIGRCVYVWKDVFHCMQLTHNSNTCIFTFKCGMFVWAHTQFEFLSFTGDILAVLHWKSYTQKKNLKGNSTFNNYQLYFIWCAIWISF